MFVRFAEVEGGMVLTFVESQVGVEVPAEIVQRWQKALDDFQAAQQGMRAWWEVSPVEPKAMSHGTYSVPAFPVLSRRDVFAAVAMHAMLSAGRPAVSLGQPAYEIADDMLAHSLDNSQP